MAASVQGTWKAIMVCCELVQEDSLTAEALAFPRRSNDVHYTKTMPSLAEVEERRVGDLRIFASGVAGVGQGLFICAMPKRCQRHQADGQIGAKIFFRSLELI